MSEAHSEIKKLQLGQATPSTVDSSNDGSGQPADVKMREQCTLVRSMASEASQLRLQVSELQQSLCDAEKRVTAAEQRAENSRTNGKLHLEPDAVVLQTKVLQLQDDLKQAVVVSWHSSTEKTKHCHVLPFETQTKNTN